MSSKDPGASASERGFSGKIGCTSKPIGGEGVSRRVLCEGKTAEA
jgi:hypothetical protein